LRCDSRDTLDRNQHIRSGTVKEVTQCASAGGVNIETTRRREQLAHRLLRLLTDLERFTH
jgi:hypothetical protein